MALTKEINFMGFTTQAYAKIVRSTISDYVIDGVKKYTHEAVINTFSNSTKEFVIGSNVVTFKDLELENCNFSNLYVSIKGLPEWEEWIDA